MTTLKLTRKEWTEPEWDALEKTTCKEILEAPNATRARSLVARRARNVLRRYSTSFFLVTRFLPPPKRTNVELVYAAVRYPDEIVDTFPLPPREKLRRLNAWAARYEQALRAPSLREGVAAGVPPFVMAFAQLVRDARIPEDHYQSFLEAMRMDVTPRPFETIDDLLDNYVYGSAVVVGFFLAHVYGSRTPSEFGRALTCSRELGVALQLTNFLRDIPEDHKRGRLYLPLDMLHEEGLRGRGVTDPVQQPAVQRVVRRLAIEAERRYARSHDLLDSFAADSQPAIRACVELYRELNRRIANRFDGSGRESVPALQKFRSLPASKYWRVPMAYLGS